MNRRQFINRSAALLAVGSIVSCCSQINKGRIGIQLYSVRNDLPKDFEGTLKKLSAMGYSAVEIYGLKEGKFFNRPIKEVNNMLKDMGMSISSTHTGSSVLPEDTNAKEWDLWKECAASLKSVGAKWAVQIGRASCRERV